MRSASRSPKRLALLGATGSIGRQVCDLVLRFPERFELRWAVAGQDAAAIEAIARRHPGTRTLLAHSAATETEAAGRAICEAMQDPDVDLVVIASAGSAALAPTLAALEAGKDIALATKEVLVMAGELVRERMQRHGANLFPVDSEHSAIWQCLWGEQRSAVRKLILTGSGGPFLRRPLETLETVTINEALAHPRWKMGPKITVDSATMMNKALELIELHHLFDVPYDRMRVLIHPQSMVHAFVDFYDGSTKAVFGLPDMRIPISIVLGYPERLARYPEPMRLEKIGRLDFEEPDPQRFPAIPLGLEAGRKGQTYPAVLNAANEMAVQLFLDKHIAFDAIVPLVADALDAHDPRPVDSLETLMEADAWARHKVGALAV